MRRMISVAALVCLEVMSLAQTTPQSCLARLNSQVDALLAKEQPKLFAWHLRSLKALAQTEFAKLELQVPQSREQTVATREKEFVEYVGTISAGLDRDCSNPDVYLKDGRRSLVLARPSAIDGTLQYTMVGLPKNWDPARAYPLYVGLHGSGPENPLAYVNFGFGPLGPEGAPKANSEMISLTPWGRGNRGWRNDAEVDLWEAIAQLKTIAKLDPDRWYITGHSSGADGCWAIVQHTPDLWAAAGPQSGSMVSGRPEWGLIPNMAYVPTYLLIGEKDALRERVPDMKEAYSILKGLGGEVMLSILPGVGHYPLTDEGIDAQTTWMVGHVRRRPDRFKFTIDQAMHPGVWGITVPYNPWATRLIQQPWPSFECAIKGQDVRITTKRIKELRVDLGSSGLKMSGDVRLWVNGKKVHDGPVPAKPIDVKDL